MKNETYNTHAYTSDVYMSVRFNFNTSKYYVVPLLYQKLFVVLTPQKFNFLNVFFQMVRYLFLFHKTYITDKQNLQILNLVLYGECTYAN